MDVGVSLFLALVAFVGIGLAYFHVRDAVRDLYAHYVAPAAVLPRDRSDDARNVHSEALERPWNDAVPEIPERAEWTREDLVTFLAGIRVIDATGSAQPLAKAKIAAVAGLRAEDAADLIRAARGEPEPSGPVLRVRDAGGERVIAR